jgi:hypothetical protein
MRRWRSALVAAAVGVGLLGHGPRAHAHVGSPDVVFEGAAGPYSLLVTIQPPEVIPGVAIVDVQSPSAPLRLVSIVPLPLQGPGAALPPTADVAHPLDGDRHRFVGRIWLMAPGTWQVRIHVQGERGDGQLAIPVPALPLRTKTIQGGLGLGLIALLVFLLAGLVSIVGASVRDADLDPAQRPDDDRRRRSLIARVIAAGVLVGLVAGGAAWWSDEASVYGGRVYRPLTLTAATSVDGDGTTGLWLTLADPRWGKARRMDDLVPDHDHLMHLFVVRVPALDVVAHLHPEQAEPGRFHHALPALPAGQYQLFADVVHATGLAETATTLLSLPAIRGAVASSDDAVGEGSPLGAVAAGDHGLARLPDGTRVIWLDDAGSGASDGKLLAGRTTWFRFRVEDADGRPATDVTPYMGMAGHAAFIKSDRSVFAHIHPSGSVSMASLAVMDAGGGAGNKTATGTPANPHAGHAGHHATLPPEISFPYACPTPGLYRLMVQFKRGDAIHTAFFEATVLAAPIVRN